MKLVSLPAYIEMHGQQNIKTYVYKLYIHVQDQADLSLCTY
jgi:hypothetical protein